MTKSSRVAEEHLSLEHRSTYRLSILNAILTRALAGSMARRFGLNFAAWRTLTVIGRFEPIFPGGIGERMSLGSDRVARAVNELVEKGLVSRGSDPDDRRRITLTLTSKGRRIYKVIDDERRAAEAKFLSVLTADEQRVFHACMTKLEAQARRMYASEGSADGRDLESRRRPSGASARGRQAAVRP